MSTDFSQDDLNQLKEYLGYGAGSPENKQNVHSFLNNIVQATDTTKLGNLEAAEVGVPKYSTRTLKMMGLISRDIIGSEDLAKHFEAESEILTSTSLSKNAKLINLAVSSKRFVEDQTKPERKENSGWFKKKKDKDSGEEEIQ